MCRVSGLWYFIRGRGKSPAKAADGDARGEQRLRCGDSGNFDDAQGGVKKLFCNPQVTAMLQEQNRVFSSANSINWGRLLPQIVYYVSAYCDLVRDEQIALGT